MIYTKSLSFWTLEQCRLLKIGNFEDLDLENIVEEIEDLGNHRKHSLTSFLKNIFLHLLKWQYRSERRGRSWYLSISNGRDEVNDILEENPGLGRVLDECFEKGYGRAKRKAARETGLPISTFPKKLPWTKEQILNEDFLPDYGE